MTYGDVQSQVRDAVCEALTYRRALRGVGGPVGRIPEITTADERVELSMLLQRYRLVVVRWLEDLMDAALQDVVAPDDGIWIPARRLVGMLTRVCEHDVARAPTLEQLVRPQPLPMVEAWRRCAVVAVEGRERELPLLRHRFSQSEALTVFGDVADLSRALVFFDERYRLLPGWRRLGNGVRPDAVVQTFTAPVALMSAAAACNASLAAVGQQSEATVDALGYRRPVEVVDGPYAPGMVGALDALANSFRRLRDDFPTGRALRALVRVHHDVSRHAARLSAADPVLLARFERRTRTYRRLLAAVRNVDGLVGRGMDAVVDASAALELLTAAKNADASELAALARGLAATDRRVCDIVRAGAAQRLYFAAVGKHIEQVRHGVMSRATTTWMPITPESQPELLQLVHDLWPEPLEAGSRGEPTDRRRLGELLPPGRVTSRGLAGLDADGRATTTEPAAGLGF